MVFIKIDKIPNNINEYFFKKNNSKRIVVTSEEQANFFGGVVIGAVLSIFIVFAAEFDIFQETMREITKPYGGEWYNDLWRGIGFPVDYLEETITYKVVAPYYILVAILAVFTIEILYMLNLFHNKRIHSTLSGTVWTFTLVQVITAIWDGDILDII